ncbi:hypothetical protein 1 [Wenzhou picorna-like virus 21]|uniref:hypothetical protein 1 n=1 Tax=Wenzhou picorna-like virus 21 TaxID=1923606 RepID=UPI00090972A3|nr:hypothetical protein 1 [Wenzhou picorna-like virus 21]APG78541.1 hypothetical protein 1 [Wenzhou picorna-like virus 21]
MIHLSRIISILFVHEMLDREYMPKFSWIGLIDFDLLKSGEKGRLTFKDHATVVKSLTVLIRNIIKGQSAVSSVNTVEEFIDAVSFLEMNRFNRCKLGAKPLKGQVSADEYKRLVMLCHDFLKIRNIRLTSTTSALFRQYNGIFNEIFKDISDEARVHAEPCLNVALFGPSGVGKTSMIVPALLEAVARARQVKFDAATDQDRIYRVVPNDEYMSGFQPHKTLCCIFDEMGAYCKGHEQMMAQILSGICELTDDSISILNRAHLDEKGRVIYNPMLNVMISNDKTFGIDKVYERTTPTFRRFDLIFEVVVKPEYRKANGVGIDKRKISEGEWDVVFLVPYVLDKDDTLEEKITSRSQVSRLVPLGEEKQFLTLAEACSMAATIMQNTVDHKDVMANARGALSEAVFKTSAKSEEILMRLGQRTNLECSYDLFNRFLEGEAVSDFNWETIYAVKNELMRIFPENKYLQHVELDNKDTFIKDFVVDHKPSALADLNPWISVPYNIGKGIGNTARLAVQSYEAGEAIVVNLELFSRTVLKFLGVFPLGIYYALTRNNDVNSKKLIRKRAKDLMSFRPITSRSEILKRKNESFNYWTIYVCVGLAVYIISQHFKDKTEKHVSRAHQELSSKQEEEIIGPDLMGERAPPTPNITGNPYNNKEEMFIHSKSGSMDQEMFQQKVLNATVIVKIKYSSLGTHHGVEGYYETVLRENGFVNGFHLAITKHSARFLQDDNAELTIYRRNFKPSYVKNDVVIEAEECIVPLFRASGLSKYVYHVPDADTSIIFLPALNAPNTNNLIAQDFIMAGDLKKVKGWNIYRDLETHQAHTSEQVICWKAASYIVDPAQTPVGTLPGYFMNQECFVGSSEDDGFSGRCGSPLMIKVGKQYSIAGIYVSSGCKNNLNSHGYMPLNLNIFSDAQQYFDKTNKYFKNSASIELANVQGLKNILHDVQPLSSSRSTMHYMKAKELGSMRYLGCWKSGRSFASHSKVVQMPLYDVIMNERRLCDYHHDLIKPSFTRKLVEIDGEIRSVGPRYHSLSKSGSPATGFNMKHLEAVMEDMIERYLEMPGIFDDRDLDIYSILSGDKDSAWVGPMPRDTSDGFIPHAHKKHKHLFSKPTEQAPNGVMLEAAMHREFLNLIVKLSKGERIGMVGVACDKDEPRSRKKVEKGNIRVFNVVDMHWYMLMKRYFGVFMGVFTENFLASETMCGVNPFSTDWDQIAKKLLKHPNCVNGDFKKYDKSMSALLIMAVLNSIYIIKVKVRQRLKRGVPQCWIKLMRAMIDDMCFPITLDGKDIVELMGTIFSGMLLTLLLNNCCNSFLIRLCWLNTADPLGRKEKSKLLVALKNFQLHVAFQAQGDDNTWTVSDEIKDTFNFMTLHNFCKKIGMQYTRADKSEDLYEYEPSTEITICKRRFVWDEERQKYLAPLEKESLGKMITIGLASKALSPREQQISGLETFFYELAQHGRAEFERVSAIMAEIMPEDYPPVTVTYDDIVEKISGTAFFPWLPADNDKVNLG